MKYIPLLGMIFFAACGTANTISDPTSNGIAITIAPGVITSCVSGSSPMTLRLTQGDRSVDVEITCVVGKAYRFFINAWPLSSVASGDPIELFRKRTSENVSLAKSVIAKNDTDGARVGFSSHTTRMAAVLDAIKTTGPHEHCVRTMAALLARWKTTPADLGTNKAAIASAIVTACGSFAETAKGLPRVDLSGWIVNSGTFLSELTHQDVTDSWIEKDSSETFYHLLHEAYPFFSYSNFVTSIWSNLAGSLNTPAPLMAEQARRMARYCDASDMLTLSYAKPEESLRAVFYSTWHNGWSGYYNDKTEELMFVGYLDQTFAASDIQTQNQFFLDAGIMNDTELTTFFYPALAEVLGGDSTGPTVAAATALALGKNASRWWPAMTTRNYTIREAMGMIAAASHVGVAMENDLGKLTKYGTSGNASDQHKFLNILARMKADLDANVISHGGYVEDGDIATAMAGSYYNTKWAACALDLSITANDSNCKIALRIKSALRLMALDMGGVAAGP